MRSTSFLVLAVLLVSVLYGIGVLTTGQDWGGDFAGYIMQTESIIKGDIDDYIAKNRFTIESSSWRIASIAYPWGLPVLLSPLYALFGRNLILLKSINILFYPLFLLCLYALFNNRLPQSFRIIVLMFFACNPEYIRYCDSIISDIPFLFFSTLSVLLIDRIILQNEKLFMPAVDYILLGAVIFTAFFIRMNGVLLLGTLLICQVIRLYSIMHRGNRQPLLFVRTLFSRSTLTIIREKRNQVGVGILPYGVFLALFLILSIFFPEGGTSHFSHFSRLSLHILAYNLGYYFQLPERFFLCVPFDLILYGFLLPFFLVGVCATYKKDYHFLIYSSLTVILYCIWPHRQGVRFYFPIIPFFIYFAFNGMLLSVSVLPGNWRRAGRQGVYLFSFILCALFALHTGRAVLKNIKNERVLAGPFDETSREMFDFVKSYTESSSIILFFKPRVMRMITGRDAVMVNTASQIDRGDYLVYHYGGFEDHIPEPDIQKLISDGILVDIYRNTGFSVFKINK